MASRHIDNFETLLLSEKRDPPKLMDYDWLDAHEVAKRHAQEYLDKYVVSGVPGMGCHFSVKGAKTSSVSDYSVYQLNYLLTFDQHGYVKIRLPFLEKKKSKDAKSKDAAKDATEDAPKEEQRQFPIHQLALWRAGQIGMLKNTMIDGVHGEGESQPMAGEERLELSHLCHNKVCINVKHLVIEPRSTNAVCIKFFPNSTVS